MPHALTVTQSLILMIGPMICGLLSFVSACTIVIMILRSATKLTKPYRRIVFGMSLYDIVNSFAAVSSAFPSPMGSRFMAMGNTQTCVAQGFLTQVGSGQVQALLEKLMSWAATTDLWYRNFNGN